MKVTLLHWTPLWVASTAIRTCWQSEGKSDTQFFNEDHSIEMTKYDHDDYIMGEKDCDLVDEVGNKRKHASTLEHVSFNFYIEGVSRALLQELARHRIASLSVKSTRYTLKELKGEAPFVPTENDIRVILGQDKDYAVLDKDYSVLDNQANLTDSMYTTELWERASVYLVQTDVPMVDYSSLTALENLRKILVTGISNDRAKYCLPEAYKTELTWTVNIRSLQNFLNLRSDKSALWEIQQLAGAIYDVLPEESKYLFEIKTYE